MINKVRDSFISLELKNKFTFINIVFILIPILAFSAFIFNTTKQTKIREQVKNLEIEIHRSYNQIEKNLEVCNMSTQVMLNNRSLIEQLETFKRNETIDIQELMAFNTAEIHAIDRLINSNPYLYQIRIYLESDTMLELMPVLYRKERLHRQSWFVENKALENEWKFDYIDNIFPDYVVKPIKNMAALVTDVYDTQNQYLGVLEVSIYMATLFPDMYTTSEERWMGFIDTQENLYYDKEGIQDKWEEYIPSIMEKIDLEKEEQYIVDTIHKEPVVIGYKPMKQLSGGIIKVVSLKKDINSINRTRNIFIIGIIGLMVIFTFSINRVVNMILKKFYMIINIIRKVQIGELDVEVPDMGKDELGELATNIKKMLNKMNYLMEDKVKREVIVKDAEIRALQNQINAHFIYNVLESIKMMAEIEEKYDISDAVTALGKLLRYSMKWTSPKVRVEEEVSYIKNYITLLNLRYDYEIILSINIPEILWKQLIPKMSLQPIIENAIYHGIEELAEDTTIYIKGKLEQGYFYIEITDAGIGMNEKELDRLNKKIAGDIQEERSSSNGIGLKNVQDRIHLCFGEEYGISIVAKEACYTKVLVKIPLDYNETGERDE